MAVRILFLGTCIAYSVIMDSVSAGFQEDFELPHVSLSQSPKFEAIRELPRTQVVNATFQMHLDKLSTIDVPIAFFSQELIYQARDLSHGLYGDPEATSPLLLPSPLIELINMGPVIVPLLIEELDNDLPIKAKLNIHREESIRFFDRLHGNAANRREARVLGLSKRCYVGSFEDHRTVPGRSVAVTQAESYQFCVGDACFVVLGRIVGRNYQCLQRLDAFTMAICSTVFQDQMRIRVQSLWRGPTPCKAVYESLMYDFSTVGVTSDGSRDDWAQGNDLQVAAAIRLIRYFPVQSRHAIRRRLITLDLTGKREESDRVNGVDAEDLILAIGATRDPELLV